MPETFESIAALVQEEIRKPSVGLSRCEFAVREAGRFIERLNSWQYMNRFVTFSFDTTAAEPRAITLPNYPNTRLKSIEFVRIVLSDGSFHYTPKVDARDVSGVKVDLPNGYWMDGFDYLWFDNTPDQDYSAEMNYIQKSDWAGFTAESTNWLFDNATDAIMSRAIIMMAPYIREPKLIQLYQEKWSTAMQSMLAEDEEPKYHGRDDSMQYLGH